MKYNRLFVWILVLVISVSFLGCRTKEAPQKAQSYEGIELTYYKMFDDADAIEPIIDQYQASHPGLKIHYKKFTDFEEYVDTILNEMAEGEGPDIFSMQNTWFASNLKKLTPMPEAFGNTEAFAKTFVDVAYDDLVLVDEDGKEKIFALPMTVDTLALYYNKAHFEDRIPSRGIPADTWEGVKEDVPLLIKENNSFERFEVAGIAMGRADNISRGVDILYLLLLQYGVDFYNDNVSEAIFAGQQGGFSNYPGVDALEFFLSFADPTQKHYTWNEYIVSQNSQEKELEAFARGQLSMMVGFSYGYDEILNQINILKSQGVSTIDPDDVLVAEIPQLYDPDISTEKRVTYANYFAEAVSRNTDYPDVAWDFVIELTEKKNLEHYFDAVHKPTSRRDMIAEQMKHPIYGVFASQIGYAESFPIVNYHRYKDLFVEVITNASAVGSSNADFVRAQDAITEMLPEEGLLNPLVVPDPEADQEK